MALVLVWGGFYVRLGIFHRMFLSANESFALNKLFGLAFLFSCLSTAEASDVDVCSDIRALAVSRHLGEHSVEYFRKDDVLKYQMVFSGEAEVLSVQCGASSDAECEFKFDFGGRVFFDGVDFRVIELQGKYYLVYGVAYTMKEVEVKDFRVVEVRLGDNVTVCDEGL